MQQRESVVILLISQVAEEIKLATLSFRRFFPGCRVEVVYTLEEAFQWTQRAPWRLILIDEQLIREHPTPILPELKRLVPSATLVLQTDQTVPTSASDTLQAGADFLLYKKSPAFLTELVLYAKDTFEKQDVRLAFEQLQSRHGRLTETLTDVLYELDSEGRFVYLSPSVADMLGYSPEELVGAPYSRVIAPDQLDRARYRFDDRRTGDRASRSVEIELAPKVPPDRKNTTRIKAELTAKGLYNAQRQRLGTIGLLRDVSIREHQETTIRRLERQLKQTDQLLATAQQLVGLSKDLKTPQASLLTQSQQLLDTIRDIRLIERVEALALSAEQAARLGDALTHIAVESNTRRETINDLIEAVLRTTAPHFLDAGQVECVYASDLPLFTGNRDAIVQLFRILLLQALRYTTVVPNQHRLKISTAAFDGIHRQLVPDLSQTPSGPTAEIHIHIEETDTMITDAGLLPPETGDLYEAYGLLSQVGGRLDFLAPANGPLSIRISVPIDFSVQPPTTAAEQTSSMQSPSSTTFGEAVTHSSTSTGPLPDRRNSARLAVQYPVHLTIDSRIYTGTITSWGQGGLDIQIDGYLPAIDKQPAYILVKTDTETLELQAIAHDRSSVLIQLSSNPIRSCFVLLFTTLSTVEEQNHLSALLNKLRVHTLTLTVEALLASKDTDESSLPVRTEDHHDADHRESLRVRVKLSVQVNTSSRATTVQSSVGLVVNLSRDGACIQLSHGPQNLGDLITLHLPPSSLFGLARMHESPGAESVLSARIVWTTQNHKVASQSKPGTEKSDHRIGVRFTKLTAIMERAINEVVGQHIMPSMNFDLATRRSSIVSAAWECRNDRSQTIAVIDNHTRHEISSSMPIVILVPGYGRTHADYLLLTSYLVANHFRVLRYDHTNHLGQSDGTVQDTTLGSMGADLQNILLFARATWPTAKISLLAEDIAARVALKIMAQSWPADHLFLLNPVVDLRTALFDLYHHDVVAAYLHGFRKGIANLWGFNVNLDQFIDDAIAEHYTDVQRTEADLSALLQPPTIFTSPARFRPAKSGIFIEAFNTPGRPPVIVPLPHDISGESTLSHKHETAAFHATVHRISSYSREELPTDPVNRPTPHDIQTRLLTELEQTRIRHHVSQTERDSLWIDHLAQLPLLESMPDYKTLQAEVYRQLLPLTSGTTILDIGCGQGTFADLLSTNRAYWSAHGSIPITNPLRYIGLSRSQTELSLAQQSRQTRDREPGASMAPLRLVQQVDVTWLAYDWEASLPVETQSVERILYTLSLSFMRSPLHALREAIRVLHADGIIVAICFQPHTDLSMHFRQQAQSTGQDEFGTPAQQVLHHLGRVREAIRHGVLHSYGRNELASLLIHAGAQPLRIVPVFDNQLLLVVARKSKLSS